MTFILQVTYTEIQQTSDHFSTILEWVFEILSPVNSVRVGFMWIFMLNFWINTINVAYAGRCVVRGEHGKRCIAHAECAQNDL